MKNFLPVDQHTHTFLCKHAEGKVQDYVDQAVAKGLAGMACTDHVPFADNYDAKHRMTVPEFAQYRAMCEAVRVPAGYPFMVGVEADYFTDGISGLRDWLKGKDLDVVLGSVHALDTAFTQDVIDKNFWRRADVSGAWRRYFELMGELVRSRVFDVVAHFDVPKRGGPRLKERELRELVLPILDQMAALDVGLEMNTSGWRHGGVDEPYPGPEVLAWAAERGVTLSFGSDAHRPEQVGWNFAGALKLARETGFKEYAVFRKREKTLLPLPEGTLVGGTGLEPVTSSV